MDDQRKYWKRQQLKITISVLFSAFFLLCIGSSFTLLMLDQVFHFSVKPLTFERLMLLTALSFTGLVLSILYRLYKRLSIKNKDQDSHAILRLQQDFLRLEKAQERFEEDCKLALKSQLRISILFWTHYYKREKMMSYKDAKNEIFKNMRKEFSQIDWMRSLVRDIKKEIDDFDRSKVKTH